MDSKCYCPIVKKTLDDFFLEIFGFQHVLELADVARFLRLHHCCNLSHVSQEITASVGQVEKPSNSNGITIVHP